MYPIIALFSTEKSVKSSQLNNSPARDSDAFIM